MSEAPGSTRFDATPLSSDHETRFVEQNMRRVFLLIYRMVGNVADAQDLTQEAFIKALQRQDQLKDLEKAAHWLSRIASNTAIDFLRRSGRVSFSDIDTLPEPLSGPTNESPEQLVLRSEHREHLDRHPGQPEPQHHVDERFPPGLGMRGMEVDRVNRREQQTSDPVPETLLEGRGQRTEQAVEYQADGDRPIQHDG